MTYLLALESAYKKHHNQPMIPAAVVYTYVKNPRTPASEPVSYDEAKALADINGALNNKGYFTDDIDMLEKMDEKLLTYKSKGPYVPVRITGKGTIHSGDMKIVKSAGDFDIMCRYTESIMADTGSAIGKGQFPIAPYQLNKAIPCSYCDYKTVCRFDNERNQYNYLSSLNEVTALEKMHEVLNGTSENVASNATSKSMVTSDAQLLGESVNKDSSISGGDDNGR